MLVPSCESAQLFYAGKIKVSARDDVVASNIEMAMKKENDMNDGVVWEGVKIAEGLGEGEIDVAALRIWEVCDGSETPAPP